MHFDLHGIFFEREVDIRSIGDLRFSDCRIYVWKRVLCGVSVAKRSCVQRPTSHVHEQHWRHMGRCEERHFYKRTCTFGSDTACQHVDDTFFHILIFSSFVTCMRCGLDVCPLIGATATSTNDVFFAAGETATAHESYTKKRPIFDHRLCFSMWSRLNCYDSILLKPPCSRASKGAGSIDARLVPFIVCADRKSIFIGGAVKSAESKV